MAAANVLPSEPRLGHAYGAAGYECTRIRTANGRESEPRIYANGRAFSRWRACASTQRESGLAFWTVASTELPQRMRGRGRRPREDFGELSRVATEN
jgi:hypothetical protein